MKKIWDRRRAAANPAGWPGPPSPNGRWRGASRGRTLMPISRSGASVMAFQSDLLSQLSDALAARVASAGPLVAGIAINGRFVGAGILWRRDVVVASEQLFPKAPAAE